MTTDQPTNTLTDAERETLAAWWSPDDYEAFAGCVAAVESILAARGGNTDNTLRAVYLTPSQVDDLRRWLGKAVDGGVSLHQEAANEERRIVAALDAAPAPTVTTHLLHAFDRQTGICRCGDGPFTVPEWVEHYHAQETPTLTERTDR